MVYLRLSAHYGISVARQIILLLFTLDMHIRKKQIRTQITIKRLPTQNCLHNSLSRGGFVVVVVVVVLFIWFSICFVARLKLFKHIFWINKIRLNSSWLPVAVLLARSHIHLTCTLNMYKCVTIADMTKISNPCSLNASDFISLLLFFFLLLISPPCTFFTLVQWIFF